jgi:hypothetical protein
MTLPYCFANNGRAELLFYYNIGNPYLSKEIPNRPAKSYYRLLPQISPLQKKDII